jgi:hypothetical protein
MLVKPGQAAVERGVLEERLLSSVAAGLVYEVSCSCNQIETMGRTGVGRWRRLPRGWHLSRSRLGWKAVQNQFGRSVHRARARGSQQADNREPLPRAVACARGHLA